MPDLRVFLNASALPKKPAGAGVYMLQLAAALAARPELHISAASPTPLAGTTYIPVSEGGPLQRFHWELRSLGKHATSANADIYHGLHFYTPRALAIPKVTTVHDLTFFRIPRRYSLQHRAYYGAIARSIRWADRVIVPSSAVASDVVRYLGYSPSNIRVVPEAPRSGLCAASPGAVQAFRAQHGITGRYLACLGTTEPGKRTVDAIRALPQIVDQHPDVSLVVAGNPGRLSASLTREAIALGVASRVQFVGYVPDDALPAFLTGAEALIFPSLYEGFGLPPLEAMACGTPVISTQAPAMDEMLGEAAAFVPLRSPESIAREASRILGDSSWSAELRSRGTAHASRFSWAKAAEQTEAVYRELLS